MDEAPPLNRHSLRLAGRLLKYAAPYRGWLIVGIVAMMVSAGLSLLFPRAIQMLVDTVLIQRDSATLNRIALALLGVFLVQSVLTYVNQLIIASVGERVVATIRGSLFRQLQALSLSFYDNHRTGDIVSRMTNDVSLLQQAITSDLMQMITQIMALVAGVIFLFLLDWQLTLIILVSLPVLLVVVLLLGSRIEKASDKVQSNLALAANIVEENAVGARIVKSFARGAHEMARFGWAVEQTRLVAMTRARASALMSAVISFLGFAAIALALWFGAQAVIGGRMTPGSLVAYLIYTLLVAGSMGLLAALYGQFQSALGASQRVFELLDMTPAITDHPATQPLPAVKGQVEFEHVCFGYSPDVPIVHDVNFVAKPGQMIALVGPSGSGKSTLMSLLARFYDVTGGAIKIDGHDIRDVTLDTLSSQIGIVPQDTLLFAQSIADNIRYGKLDATAAEVEAAARAANAHDFIVHELENGYDTLVGERGMKLSGGQRQRIAVARAILKAPRILILDEATSSLDSTSERLIQTALETLMRGRTSFVIAHRLSTVTNADGILVLKDGRIVESGTHAALMSRPNGLYQHLHQAQFALNGTNKSAHNGGHNEAHTPVLV